MSKSLIVNTPTNEHDYDGKDLVVIERKDGRLMVIGIETWPGNSRSPLIYEREEWTSYVLTVVV